VVPRGRHVVDALLEIVGPDWNAAVGPNLANSTRCGC